MNNKNLSGIILSFFLLSAFTSNAQEAFWAKAVSGPDYEYGIDSDIDSQGNMFIIGYGTGPALEIDSSSHNTNGDGDAFIAKFSNSRQLLWFKTLGGDDNTYYDSGLDIHVDDNDNVIILVNSAGNNFTYDGHILQGINSPGQYSGEGVIIKVDNNGNYLWHDDGSVSSCFKSAATDELGNVYLTGWFSYSITLGDSIQLTNTTSGTTMDMFVAKYSPDGHILWAKNAGGTVHNSFEAGHNIAYDKPSGKVVVIGEFNKDVYFDTGVLTTTANYSTFMVEYDSSGTELWNKSLFSSSYTLCHGLDISSNGLIGVAGSESPAVHSTGRVGFYDLNGNVQSEVSYVSSTCLLHSIDFNLRNECFISGYFKDSVILGVAPDTIILRTPVFEGFLLKLNSSLVLDWTKLFPSSSLNKVTCKNNRILYAGRIDEPFIYNNGTQTITNNNGDAIFCEFSDPTCSVSDTSISSTMNSITANNLSASYQWLNCNNNYSVIAGEVNQTFHPTVNGMYAVQLTEIGCIDTSRCVPISAIGIIENEFGNKLAVFPNPTSGDFSIELGENYQTITVNLTDLIGKTIQSETFQKNQFVHIKFEAPAGVYFLKIKAGSKKATVRLVKE